MPNYEIERRVIQRLVIEAPTGMHAEEAAKELGDHEWGWDEEAIRLVGDARPGAALDLTADLRGIEHEH